MSKTKALSKSRPRDRAEMLSAVRRHLFRRQKQPRLIENLFREQFVNYTADNFTHYSTSSSVTVVSGACNRMVTAPT